jgi:hypothetical protein
MERWLLDTRGFRFAAFACTTEVLLIQSKKHKNRVFFLVYSFTVGTKCSSDESLPERNDGQGTNMSIDSCGFESSGFIIA